METVVLGSAQAGPLLRLRQLVEPTWSRPGIWNALRRACSLGLLRVLAVGLLVTVSATPSSAEFAADFFRSHCLDCHTGPQAEAGLDLSRMTWEAESAENLQLWERIFDRVDQGEMPPPDYAVVAPADKQTLVKALRDRLVASHLRVKGTVLRRLNRREYENTLNDLFGTHLDLYSLLPADGQTREFDNVGASLGMSTVQMQRYLEGIRQVLDSAIAKQTSPVQAERKQVSYADTREGQKFIGSKWLQLDDGAVVFFQDWGYPTGMLRDASTRRAGRYRIRVTGYAYQSDSPLTFALGATTFARGVERPTFGYFSLNPLRDGQPTVVEIEAWMEARYMVEITPQGIFDSKYFIKQHGLDSYPGPGLAILHVELEGPLVDEFPSRGHQLLFGGLARQEVEPQRASDRTKPWYQPQFRIVTDAPRQAAEQALLRVYQAASRRPVEPQQLAGYVQLFESEFAKDGDFEQAYKTAVCAIFCSPEFLYFQEAPGRLDDYALANRLSYFLTRTLPDAELRQLAAAGQLHEPQTLAEQVERLLADTRSERFVRDFCDAWLNLREIDFTSPDAGLFPEFDAYLQFSMLAESRAYFRALLDRNLEIRNLVVSDFAMLNERLAEHYGIEGVAGPDIRPVSLSPNSCRGGILGQAAVHKVSANGTNTSPVVRGVWVMERLLGQHPTPPPPGIPGVEPDTRGALTVREILDRHRSLEQCNGCHAHIDPPGFALECFNPIGGYRERFRSLVDGDRVDSLIRGRRVRYKLGLPVDASGKLADGRAFEDYLQFRELLAADEQTLCRNLACKLLVFATGRELGFSDRDEVDRIVQASASSGSGMKDLVHLVVQSDIFKRK